MAATAVSPPMMADQAADRFGAIYDAHFAMVWRNLRRLGVSPASLDDAAQDVFLVVHRRAGEIDDARLRPWLFGVIRRVAAEHRRGSSRRAAAPLDEAAHATVQGPLVTMAQAEASQVVHQALDDLDGDKREVFVLVELEQMTAPEVALVLSIPLNTVYSRLRVARAEFEKHAARLLGGAGRAR